MLRLAVQRSARAAEHGFVRPARSQWAPQRIAYPARRTYADIRPTDKTVLPGSASEATAGVPQPPVLQHATSANVDSTMPAPPARPADIGQTAEKVAHAAQTVSSVVNTTGLPPTGSGQSSTGPASIPPPPPQKPRRRIRSFLMTLLILGALGYGGGVYYSLVSDNFHDFFTEYVPYGEDAVAYFEDREFRKRFPSREYTSKNWPQTRGENKVTIGRTSGLTPSVAEEDLGVKGRHTSALEENKKPSPPAGPKDTPKKETAVKTEAPKSSAPAARIDHVNVEQATEPVVQDLVKMVNNVITAINGHPEASKFSSVVENLKTDLDKTISSVGTMKDKHIHDAESQIQNAHTEFDTAAKELVRRLEQQMHEQELKFREEYEQERKLLSDSYHQKMAAELDIARQVAEQENKNSLLQQEIALQKQYMDSVKARVEEERDGRLAKIDQLSSSVSELEKLTAEWNSVVDATLQTQHLQIAVEAVKAKVLHAETPTPFLNELVALKECSGDDEVVNAAIASINPQTYQHGIASPANLIDRFRRVASEVRKASLLPEDAGIASHAASAVLSRFMFQKKADRGLPEGEDVEATLARTEVLLEEGDLDAAAREMNGLKGWAGVLSRDWVSECRRVLEVKQAVDVISTEARLKSLLVD